MAEPLVDGDPKYLIVEFSCVQVGLNTNLLYKSDLLSDGVEDPGLQLAWLRNTLMEVDTGYLWIFLDISGYFSETEVIVL